MEALDSSMRRAEAKSATPHLPTLTGLRFVAALFVFSRHVWWLFEPTRARDLFHSMFFQGGLGVSFFFILSGFVLTWSRRENDSRRAFWRRRFARIYPNHIATWIVGGVIGAAIGGVVTVPIALASLGLVQAWIPSFQYAFGMDGVSWSLSCELFFYAMFPALAAIAIRFQSSRRRVFLVLLVLGTLLLPIGARHIAHGEHLIWLVYLFPPSRLFEFIVGIVIAIEVRNGGWPVLPVAPVLGVVAAMYWLTGKSSIFTPYDAVPALVVLPFALLIARAAQADLAGSRTVFSSRAFVRLGEWSFAFYLVHFLVVECAQHAFGLVGAIAVAAGLFVVSLAASGLLYTLIERPAERHLRRSPRASTASLELSHAPATA